MVVGLDAGDYQGINSRLIGQAERMTSPFRTRRRPQRSNPQINFACKTGRKELRI
jgi:hypothetical protein